MKEKEEKEKKKKNMTTLAIYHAWGITSNYG